MRRICYSALHALERNMSTNIVQNGSWLCTRCYGATAQCTNNTPRGHVSQTA